jgi:hypothetical protein
MAAFLILGRTTAISVLESNVIEIAAFLLFSGDASLTLDDKLLLDDFFSSDSINTIDAFFLSFRSFLTVSVPNSNLETRLSTDTSVVRLARKR